MGITPQTIDQPLYDAFGQRQISTMYTQVNQYHIVLETQPDFQYNPAKLQDIYVRSALAPSALTTALHGRSCHGDDGLGQSALPHLQARRLAKHCCEHGIRHQSRGNRLMAARCR